MKNFTVILLLVCFFTAGLFAQVTNLLVGGISTDFTVASGSQFGWSYDVPTAGDTTYLQIWIDTDNNGILNSSVDVLWQSFIQIDGDPDGNNGPPDMADGADGHVSFQQNLGIAPAHYIMYFKNHNAINLVAGQITPLVSPTFTISGSVTNGGSGIKNIVVNLEAENGNNFWTGITDAGGNYSIKMDLDTTGNPWRLKIDNPDVFSPDVATPDNYVFTIDAGVATTYPNYNFTVTAAAAKVAGLLKKEDGSPAPFASVNLGYQMFNSGYFSYYEDTDANGLFQFGITANRLTGQQWMLQGYLRSSETTENYIDARITLNSINNGDSVYKVLTLYDADATITGKVSFGGNSTNIAQITIIALTDSTQSVAYNNTTDGNYTLKVSSKISANNVFGINLPQGYGQINLNDVAPGATNEDLNYNLTDVKDKTSDIPESFSLSQNYPNPFNPSTSIQYALSDKQFVQLKVFDVIGNEVATLVNEEKATGIYSVDFNASNLPSGVYFYKLQAGSFVETKKMILLK